MISRAIDVSPRSIIALFVTIDAFNKINLKARRKRNGFRCNVKDLPDDIGREVAGYMRERLPDCAVTMDTGMVSVEYQPKVAG